MGILSARRKRDDGEQRALTWAGLADMARVAGNGGTVTVERAMRTSAVWACVDILASSVSETPVDVISRRGEDRAPLENQPQIIANPSAHVSPDVWRYQLVESMATDGNAFGWVVDVDGNGNPTTIELIDAGSVVDRRMVDGWPVVRVGSEEHALWPLGPIWHVPGRVVRAGSPFGLSPVEAASGSVRASLSAEKFGNDFFDAGGHPTGLIYSDSPEMDKTQATAIKDAFIKAATGREPAVFGAGLTYEQVQTTPDKTGFLDLMRFEVEQACRYFRVPPSMAYAAVSGQSVTYANVSQADLHYLKHSLNAYFVRVEYALSALVLRNQQVVFNRNAILRSTPMERHEVHGMRLRDRTMSVNEVRRLEDEKPFDDPKFDEPGIPADIPATAGEAM